MHPGTDMELLRCAASSTSNGDWRRKQSNHKMGSVNENWSVSWAV